MKTTTQTAQKIDRLGGVSLVVGSILGSGIFIAPGLIAAFSGSWLMALAFWFVGGAACAIGAAIYGQLGLLFPQGGGQYVYLRNLMGDRYSKLYGRASLWIICPTMLAGTSLFFGELWKGYFHLSEVAVKLIGIGCIVVFTLLNSRGIRLAGFVQKALVLIHVLLLVGVLIISFAKLPGLQLSSYSFTPDWGQLSLTKGIVALAAVLWSYEGFNALTFITNEIQGGERNVRKIGVYGCAIVLALYLAFNWVTLTNIPFASLVGAPNAAVMLMGMVFGEVGGFFVFLLTILGVASVLHASLIIGPRVIAAMASDGVIWRKMSELDTETGSPTPALWFQCAITIVFILIGHFEGLITCFVVLNWLFYGVTVVGYLKFVWSAPAESRTRKVVETGFAGFFLAMVLLLIVSQFFANFYLAFLGVAVLAVGLVWPTREASAVDAVV